MAAKSADIEKQLHEMYPEIKQYGVDLNIDFNPEKNAWIATFKKGEHELWTHLEEQDVENCFQGKECYHFGIQLGQFIRNYCEGGEACRL